MHLVSQLYVAALTTQEFVMHITHINLNFVVILLIVLSKEVDTHVSFHVFNMDSENYNINFQATS